jgi:hypothetical protein
VKFPGGTLASGQLVIEPCAPTDGTPLPTPLAYLRPDLQQRCAPLTPDQLRWLHHLLAHSLLHRRRDNAGADPFALAVALAIRGDEPPVVLGCSRCDSLPLH